MLVFPGCHWCKSLAAIISFVRRPEIEGGGEESLQCELTGLCTRVACGEDTPSLLNLLSFLTTASTGSLGGQICIGWPCFTSRLLHSFKVIFLRNLPSALIGVQCSRSPRKLKKKIKTAKKKKKKSNKPTPGQHSGNYFIWEVLSCTKTAYQTSGRLSLTYTFNRCQRNNLDTVCGQVQVFMLLL